ncbi:hypothetical protein QJS10_CPA08g00337 [Acorus calamus]|uniref:Transducin/WD40 repeat-like superfamily protein n=1 Tax=Acorus calamus TaxID=4465 RepID=A0AAV9E8V1_ACOCL|nr:hypothetical protein QJS10_CPA08g00337 [Acorus calamus]
MDDNMNKAWKKPKVEEDESDMNGGGGGCSLEEQEEALVALIEHRLKEVQHLRLRATYYQSQVAEAEKKLNDSQSKLARLRSASNMARPVSNGSLSDVARPVTDGSVNVKSKRRVPERQLRLFDIRLRQTEIHAFGWKQESSESQSALINQAWSPDGFYITSGSADPTIHIFDIRYDSRKPSQSVQAHQKRVFKAVWHHSLHLLVSISSDLNIGLHRIT